MLRNETDTKSHLFTRLRTGCRRRECSKSLGGSFTYNMFVFYLSSMCTYSGVCVCVSGGFVKSGISGLG